MPRIIRATTGNTFKKLLAEKGYEVNEFADFITGKPDDSMRRNASRWLEDGPPILAKKLLEVAPANKKRVKEDA